LEKRLISSQFLSLPTGEGEDVDFYGYGFTKSRIRAITKV